MIPLYLSIPPYQYLCMFFFVQLLLLLVFKSSNNHGSSFVWNIAPLISNVGNMEVEEQSHNGVELSVFGQKSWFLRFLFECLLSLALALCIHL